MRTNSSFQSKPSLSRRCFSSLQFALIAVLPGACSVTTGVPLAEITPQINASLRTVDLVVPGDVIDVRFSGVGDEAVRWNHETTVRADGNATFLRVGDRNVAGRALRDVQDELSATYRPLLDFRNAAVSLFLKTKAPREIIVMGEVRTPGKVTVESGEQLTFLDVLGRAGGPIKETARLDSTLLVRWDPTHNRQVSWKIDAELERWASQEPLYLQPFDVVFVPNTVIDKVDIWVDQYIRKMLPFGFAGWTIQPSSLH